ncbi:hypothetical protein I7I53_00169 [Histoplasma capsulatum var. duboisii H88]|uniref:Uncharacterized protein n=1 Tax=Ajellomyces capsulatus (strain H88) TaxID=544711 RepID=A0A8A1LGN0_AJEC8|nr:hypothetical protein I7I53_00169 [Histoplasma capsulatum var. duboisii H88]
MIYKYGRFRPVLNACFVSVSYSYLRERRYAFVKCIAAHGSDNSYLEGVIVMIFKSTKILTSSFLPFFFSD